MSENPKDTIYVDVDEEITGIINKVQSSTSEIVALVLPKRASVLQSVVNMKLLKRTSDQAKKKVVLITSESKILPLAGAAGVFVAGNLSSKPYVPLPPNTGAGTANLADTPEELEEVDPQTPVSALEPNAKFADDDDGIEIDNTKPDPLAPAGAAASKKPDKKLKVPNFNRFRKKLLFGGLAVFVLLLLLVWALVFAPKAKVAVKAQTSKTELSLPFTADTTATQLDKENKTVQALQKEAVKSDSEKVESTGEENKGKTASGSVNMTARKCSGNILLPPKSVPSGTGISTSGLTYITKQTTTFTTDGASQDSQPGCYNYPAASSTPITAQKPGKQYNTGSANFSVAGRSDASASGSASGGSDDIVKVVTKTDIDRARERLNSKQNTTQDDLKTEFAREGYLAITESFKSSGADYIPSTAVGAEADEVTVTVNIKYSMLGVNQDDLKELIKQQINAQADKGAQKLLSAGLDKAVFAARSAEGLAEGQTAFKLETKVITGPDVNQDEIKQQITGKSDAEAKEILSAVTGLNEPKIELSPFWVNKLPKASKIELDIQQADGSSIPQ